MNMNTEQNVIDKDVFLDELGNPVQTQYVDEVGNPIDPSLIDESGNYIGEVTEYVDEFGNPIDPSLIDDNGNYIGNVQYIDEAGNPIDNTSQPIMIDNQDVATQLSVVENPQNITLQPTSTSEHQMDNKELLTGMVTFDYNNVPITDIVNSIILDAINKGASDIHFDPFEEGIKIRIRIDGQLNDYSIVPLYVKKNMITRIKIISGMNITESRTPQDGAIRTELQRKTVDLRVSCLPTNVGEKVVIRIMDYSMSAAGIEALDFNAENLEKVKKMLALPNGIILVTGATGTGKSTTVYSMLQRLNVEGTNLVTVEDPIEMNIGGINQVQAASEIGLTFASVLRSILRQDPDVIMIGEIRDDETARIAVRASITGHLVLSTIHTNNSLNTIERLTDMSVERYLLGSSLSGIVSQKLSRRLCEKCKRLRKTTDYEKDVFKKALKKEVNEVFEPVGCPSCSRGYRGRIAIHEVLLLNQTIKDAITKGVNKSTLRNLVYSENGTETMLQDGLKKVLEGKTSFEEILKLIDLEDDLGTGTQLGLEEQMSASNMNMGQNVVMSPTQPININITPEILSALQVPQVNTDNDFEETEEVVIKPIKKKKTVLELDPEELKQMLDEESINDDERTNDKEEEIEILDMPQIQQNKEINKEEEIQLFDSPTTSPKNDENEEEAVIFEDIAPKTSQMTEFIELEDEDKTFMQQLNESLSTFAAVKGKQNKKEFNKSLNKQLDSAETELKTATTEEIDYFIDTLKNIKTNCAMLLYKNSSQHINSLLKKYIPKVDTAKNESVIPEEKISMIEDDKIEQAFNVDEIIEESKDKEETEEISLSDYENVSPISIIDIKEAPKNNEEKIEILNAYPEISIVDDSLDSNMKNFETISIMPQEYNTFNLVDLDEGTSNNESI